MSVEQQSKATVHLQNLLGEQNALVKKLVKALRPFHDQVFNDNGDMTVQHCADNEAYIKAYFLVEKHG